MCENVVLCVSHEFQLLEFWKVKLYDVYQYCGLEWRLAFCCGSAKCIGRTYCQYISIHVFLSHADILLYHVSLI